MKQRPDCKLVCNACREPSPFSVPAPGALSEALQSEPFERKPKGKLS
jgi:hypothetical protein